MRAAFLWVGSSSRSSTPTNHQVGCLFWHLVTMYLQSDGVGVLQANRNFLHASQRDSTPTNILTHATFPRRRHAPFHTRAAVYMSTPQGRFKCNQKLCLSMSDFHPETWNPLWSVSAVLTGLLSFMLGSEDTVGSIQTSSAEKRNLARASHHYNRSDKVFRELFPEFIRDVAPTPPATASRAMTRDQHAHLSNRRGRRREEEGESLVSLLAWLFVFLALIFGVFRLIAGSP